MVPNVAGSSPVIRPIIKRPEWGVFNFGRSGREPEVRNASWQERVLTKFAPYVVNGAHSAKAAMGIYSPVIRPIFDDTPSGPCLRRGILLK